MAQVSRAAPILSIALDAGASIWRIGAMRVSDFDYYLPEDRIALRPAEPRDAARLLIVGADGSLTDGVMGDLLDHIRPGDAVVFNDTRVIPARLSGARFRDESVVKVEATLHRRISPERWAAFMKPGKRLKAGDRVRFGALSEAACADAFLDATVEAKGEGGEITLKFDLAGAELDRSVALIGVMPLPPYIAAKRAEDDQDRADYQTVYAREDGSVAAPTAGLHFTPELIARIEEKGASVQYVTLHVGAGTFLPVKVEDLADHRMHAEYGHVDETVAEALNAVRLAGGRIVCVGTTAMRLIESAADRDGRIHPFAAETDIFITPGYRFRAADVLLTNFHLPRSTLFMLVSAFSGTAEMKAAYAHAIEAGYRFYSYGDACLLFRRP